MVGMSKAADLLGEVRLRGVTEDDLPIFFEHQADPVANRMAAFPPRERDAFIDRRAGRHDPAREASNLVPGGNDSVNRSASTSSSSSSGTWLAVSPVGVSSISLRPRRINERSGAQSCAVSVRVNGELGCVEVKWFANS
jgi:hypothetical protein